MGYSATSAAFKMLEKIQEAVYKVEGDVDGKHSSNTFKTDDGREAFWEIGRENASGAITGTVRAEITEKRWMERYSQFGPYKPNHNEVIGSFKISAEGRILKFAGLPKKVRSLVTTSSG
jgi:hypothetical protein